MQVYREDGCCLHASLLPVAAPFPLSSGHRMVLHQTKASSRILLFGGFFDNGKETR